MTRATSSALITPKAPGVEEFMHPAREISLEVSVRACVDKRIWLRDAVQQRRLEPRRDRPRQHIDDIDAERLDLGTQRVGNGFQREF